MAELARDPARPPEDTKGTAVRGAEGAVVQGRWRQLSMLGGTMLIDSAESGLITGLFPVIRQSLGLSLGALGILGAAGKLIGAVTAPLWIWAAHRWSRKGVLVIATGLWGVWGVAAGFAQNFTQLLILTTVLAAGYAAAQPLITEIVGDLFDTRSRGRAVGLLYGAVALTSALLAALKGQLAGFEDGWRWGLCGIGVFNMLFGLVLWRWLRDPGHGAAEPQLADLDPKVRRATAKVTRTQITELLRIRTFRILLVSRLLSGHMVAAAFSVVFLVDVYGFTTQAASVILLPLGIGFFAGTLLGGLAADWASHRSPRHGLPAVLQAAQIAFAVVAYFGTQFDYGSLAPFALFFALMGMAQGVNPGINRPMVMAVTPPELRGAAFTVYVSIVEALAWAVFSLSAGYLGDIIGLRAVFLWLLVILMLVNGAFLTLLYRPYADDVRRAQEELDRRRAAALS
ncbi:MFS transporter [Streptomyces sp. NPDC091406]|uniref:MFS transporter n=1 Tax=unclassified Streptomyces TaxID=2593676 RepID=UPI0037FF93CA